MIYPYSQNVGNQPNQTNTPRPWQQRLPSMNQYGQGMANLPQFQPQQPQSPMPQIQSPNPIPPGSQNLPHPVPNSQGQSPYQALASGMVQRMQPRTQSNGMTRVSPGLYRNAQGKIVRG